MKRILDTRKHNPKNTLAVYDGPFPISIHQNGFDNFAVVYGLQVKNKLTYDEAALELGACLMHALACDERLDNRTKSEAKKDGEVKAQFRSVGA
jgi:hypothetical protein